MKLKHLFQLIGIVLCSVLMAVPGPAQASTNVTQQQGVSMSISYEELIVPAYPVVTVKHGDTLSVLARKYNLDWHGLYCANIKVIGPDPNVIRVGMKLVMKQSKCRIGSGNTATTITTTGYRAGTPQQIAWGLLANYGGDRPSQYYCLSQIIKRESGWSTTAYNAGSGAYGIPQALPGSKMSVAGPDWATSAYTQLKWMIHFYIEGGHYRTPCGAWAFWESNGWY